MSKLFFVNDVYISCFRFDLENSMFLFVLNILQQNARNYVCVQVLQTLNILFENLQHETSLCE